MIDFIDFYIKNINEPKFNDTLIVEDDIINVIIQKYKLIIFTNKGDVLGDPNFGADIELLLFSIIDPQYICQAETSISHYLNDYKLSGYSIKEVEQTELIIINQKFISQIKEHYRLIQNSYIGHYKELNDKIVNLEKSKTKVKEVEEGTEFGMMIESKTEIVEGDIIESFNITQK